MLARRRTSTSTTAAATSCATSSFELPAGKVTALLGRNGVGKTTLLRTLMGLVPARRPARSRFDETRSHAARSPTSARAPASATCRRAARSSRGSRWRRTCEMGLATRPRGATHARAHLRDVPGAEADAAPPRRRPLGRPAAAARDRPRARDGAQAADPRRAHRGHPALDHQGHRARDPRARRDRRDGDPAGRAVLRLRALARRPVPGDGARRDRRARRGRGHGRATACSGLLAV